MPKGLKPDFRYRMPVFFGPSCGPRQGPDGRPFDWSQATRWVASVRFLTEPALLAPMLPEGCAIDGEPLVTIEHFSLRNLPWLAGRGYDALGVRFPVHYRGKTDNARGPLLLVMWENMTDAILTGREELGYSKIFADLSHTSLSETAQSYTASWCGHRFFQMELHDLAEASPPPAPAVDGLLHYRYFPAVNDTTSADVSTVTMTPAAAPTTTEKFLAGRGSAQFIQSTWEQLPTQFQIVNALASLPVVEPRGASLAFQKGAKDLSDVRVLN